MPWFGGRRWWRRALDVRGLALIHGVLWLFLTGALFGVFQQAFQGVALDRLAGTFWVAAACGSACYVISAAAASLTGRSLATLLAVLLTVGVLASTLNPQAPYWWERYFSELWEGGDPRGLRGGGGHRGARGRGTERRTIVTPVRRGHAAHGAIAPRQQAARPGSGTDGRGTIPA